MRNHNTEPNGVVMELTSGSSSTTNEYKYWWVLLGTNKSHNQELNDSP